MLYWSFGKHWNYILSSCNIIFLNQKLSKYMNGYKKNLNVNDITGKRRDDTSGVAIALLTSRIVVKLLLTFIAFVAFKIGLTMAYPVVIASRTNGA